MCRLPELEVGDDDLPGLWFCSRRGLLICCYLGAGPVPSGIFLPSSSMCTLKGDAGECVFLGSFTTFTAYSYWHGLKRLEFAQEAKQPDQKRLWFLWQCNLPKNLVELCFIHLESVLHEMSHNIPLLSSYCLKDAFSLSCYWYFLSSLLLSLIDLFKVPKFWFHFLYRFLFSMSLISIFICSISSFYLLWIKCFSSLSSFYYIFFYKLYCFIYIIRYLFNLKFLFYMR